MRKICPLPAVLLCLFCLHISSHTQAQYALPKSTNQCKVILDTDIGNDIDDMLAIDMAFKYMDRGIAELLGILNNKNSEYATRFLDLVTTWYGYSSIPIGKIENGVGLNDYVDYAKNVVLMNDSLGKVYKRSRDNNFLHSHLLCRKLLASQPDSSVILISVGFLTNIKRLLESAPDQFSQLNGKELVRKKVKYLSVMAGSFGSKKRAEFNIVNDIPSAQYVFQNCPVPIVLSPFEVGASVLYPAKSIENDFKWTSRHPLVDAYKRYRPFPYNRPTWDLTSVYYAMDPKKDLLNLSIPGTITVDKDGFIHFTDQKEGDHYFLTINDSQKEELRDYFIDLIAAKPKHYLP